MKTHEMRVDDWDFRCQMEEKGWWACRGKRDGKWLDLRVSAAEARSFEPPAWQSMWDTAPRPEAIDRSEHYGLKTLLALSLRDMVEKEIR